MTRAHDELIGRLVGAGLAALRGLAPRRNGMTATRSATFTTAVRMVDRVHGNAAVMRTLTQPALTTSLAELDVGVVRVGHGTNSRQAGAGYEALRARVQAQECHSAGTTDDLCVGACGTGDLTALAWLQLDVVNDRAHRDRRKRHCIAGLYVRTLAGGNDAVTSSQTLRSQDVADLTILVANECDECRTIRIVLEAFNSGGHIELVALKVNKAIAALVTTTLETGGNAAVVVAAALARQADGQALDGLALVEAGAVNDDQLALTGGNRLIMLKCHIPFLAP